MSEPLNFLSQTDSQEKVVLKWLFFNLEMAVLLKNSKTSILRYSTNRSLVKIFTIRLKLYAMNINPTSALALSIPFLVRI
jgi:hypothetical protein